MALTRRRRNFLAVVVRLYQESAQPVHYTRVAEALGVSRWTAYDLLRQLEKGGYLEALYETGKDEKGPGRTSVYYRPTPQALRKVERGGADDWSVLRERLLRLLDDRKKVAQEAVAEILQELPGIQERLAKAACNVAVLLAQLEEIGSRGRRALAAAVARARQPEEGLSLFAGAVMGSLLRVRGVVSEQVGECIRRLQGHLAELEPREAFFLANFVKEGLERPL
ncbi:hypothetical protein [Thermodesulfitimonas sp.]